MTRLSPIVLMAFLAACDTGLNNIEDPAPVVSQNLFPSGSQEELAVAEGMAYDHLIATQRLSGIEETDLWTQRVDIDELSNAHIKISQLHDGVEVVGGETIVHLKPNGTVNALTDSLVRDVEVETIVPSYSADDALQRAADLTQGFDKLTNLPEPQLVITRFDGQDHLAWRIQLEFLNGDGRTAMPRVFIDAESNEMLYQYDNLQSIDGSANTSYNGSITFPIVSSEGRYELRGGGVGTYTFNNAEPAWNSFGSSHLFDVTSNSTSFSADAAAIDAHYGAVKTVEFLAEVHGRNGVNGSGGPTLKESVITSGVHYGNNYNNAFWNGRAMVYGDGDGSTFSPLTSLDVAAHEMGHGVTEYTAGLVYRNESGALNEAFSDILGARVEAWVEGMSSDVWEIGEDCYTPWNSSDAMRYMDNPTQDGSSRDHYSTRYTGSADNGGVHWNSGIANLAFYLTSEGGNHPKSSKSIVDVDGIGMAKAGAIYYRALSLYMTSSTTFAGARQATLNAASDLYGQGSVEYATVGNAWAEVGVGGILPYPDGPIDDPQTPVPPPTGEGNAVDVAAATGEWVRYAVNVPVGATEVFVQMQGGTGDADLYVRAGAEPSDSAYDCRPYKSGNIEECRIENPTAGTLHIGIKAYSAFTGVALSTTVTGGQVPDEPEFEFLDESDLSDTQNGEQAFVLEVPPDASNLVFTMTGGTGDADLYVRQGSEATSTDYDCRPYRSGNEEICTITNPVAGDYHVMVRAYSTYTGVSITGTWE